MNIAAIANLTQTVSQVLYSPKKYFFNGMLAKMAPRHLRITIQNLTKKLHTVNILCAMLHFLNDCSLNLLCRRRYNANVGLTLIQMPSILYVSNDAILICTGKSVCSYWAGWVWKGKQYLHTIENVYVYQGCFCPVKNQRSVMINDVQYYTNEIQYWSVFLCHLTFGKIDILTPVCLEIMSA